METLYYGYKIRYEIKDGHFEADDVYTEGRTYYKLWNTETNRVWGDGGFWGGWQLESISVSSSKESIIISKKEKKAIIDAKTEGAICTDYIYDDVIEGYGYLHTVQNGKYGLFKESVLKEIAPCIYDKEIKYVSNGFYQVVKNGSIGLIKEDSTVVVPCSIGVSEISILNASQILVKRNKKFGLFNDSGKEVIPCIYDNLSLKQDGYLSVEKNNKYGLVNPLGNELIPCIYDTPITLRNDGFILAVKKKKCGLFNREGKEVMPCIYDEIDAFNNNSIANVKLEGKYGLISSTFEEIMPCIYDKKIGPFRKDGFALIKKNGKYGLINRAYEEFISCQYDDINTFVEDGIAVAKDKDKFGMINLNEEICLPFAYDEVKDFKSSGLASIKRNGKYGIIDYTFKEVVPCIYDEEIEDFNKDGFVCVVKNGKKGLLSRNYEEFVPCIYDYIKPNYRNDGLIDVKKGNWGLVDKNGKNIVSCIYDKEPSQFQKGYSIVKNGGKYGIIDQRGKECIECVWSYDDNSKSYNHGGLSICEDKGKWGIINNMAKIVVPLQYSNFQQLLLSLAKEMNGKGQDQNSQLSLFCKNLSNIIVVHIENKVYGRINTPLFNTPDCEGYLEMHETKEGLKIYIIIKNFGKIINEVSKVGVLKFAKVGKEFLAFEYVNGYITYSPLSNRYISTSKLEVAEEQALSFIQDGVVAENSCGNNLLKNELNIKIQDYLCLKYLVSPESCTSSQLSYLNELYQEAKNVRTQERIRITERETKGIQIAREDAEKRNYMIQNTKSMLNSLGKKNKEKQIEIDRRITLAQTVHQQSINKEIEAKEKAKVEELQKLKDEAQRQKEENKRIVERELRNVKEEWEHVKFKRNFTFWRILFYAFPFYVVICFFNFEWGNPWAGFLSLYSIFEISYLIYLLRKYAKRNKPKEIWDERSDDDLQDEQYEKRVKNLESKLKEM